MMEWNEGECPVPLTKSPDMPWRKLTNPSCTLKSGSRIHDALFFFFFLFCFLRKALVERAMDLCRYRIIS